MIYLHIITCWESLSKPVPLFIRPRPNVLQQRSVQAHMPSIYNYLPVLLKISKYVVLSARVAVQQQCRSPPLVLVENDKR